MFYRWLKYKLLMDLKLYTAIFKIGECVLQQI